ncbi:MAG: hypothetical protein EXR72_06200 [Myxococcales bacterium]|nr:hypothetical protein [Myxococcales bacterium]
MEPLSLPATNGPSGAAPRFWGRERTFGQLFGAAFGMFNAHTRWLVPLVVTAAVPGITWSLIAMNFFGMGDPNRMVQRMLRSSHPGSMLGMFMIHLLISMVIMVAAQSFTHAAIFGTLTAAGRGEPLSLGLAFDRGLRGFWTYLGASLWLGLRLLPWMLLFLVPGIIKAYAWIFALPARMAGDAPDAEAAIAMSAEATNGRKAYLFGFNILMALIIGGATLLLSGISAGLTYVAGRFGAQGMLIVTTMFASLAGVIVQLGIWLCYADAVAGWNPQSAAAAYALGVTGRPFPIPTWRRV